MSGLGLGLGLGLGAHRIVDRYGNMPATFTVTAGDGTKYVRVKVSETTTVTPAGGTSIRIGSSGEFVTAPLTLAANTNQDIYFKDAGSFTIPQRKLVITDKGKGFGGVVVANPELDEFATKVISLLKWRGPCELEVMRGFDGNYYLIEINPRFPAWVRLAEGSGQNQPAAVVLKALGQEVSPLPPSKSGTLFIRHAEDIIADISVMGEVSARSELIRR